MTAATHGFMPAPIFDEDVEAKRQEVLAELAILDTKGAAEFDGIVNLVAQLLGVPIVAVSLIDNERQAFIAATGTDVRETPRAVSFCGHAIASDAPLCVNDTLLDPRFAGNPLVTNDPNVRFYAGVPLVCREGSRLGTLCAIDVQPREPSPEYLTLLRSQAKLVMSLLEARRTTHRMAKNALLLAEKALAVERSQAMVRDLSDALSHDLAAPVRHITAFVKRLARRLPEGDRDVEMTLTAAAQMASLIGALRDYGRAGGIVDLTEVDARRCLDLAMTTVGPDLTEAQASVTIGSLPSVLAHETFLTQVFQNLLANALKYAAPGRRPEIAVDATSPTDGRVRISVRDNGIGIAPRFQAKVFDRLRRLHAQHDIPGSGLGLTLCKRVIERFGGEIGLDSEPGVGTTVWFTLYRA